MKKNIPAPGSKSLLSFDSFYEKKYKWSQNLSSVLGSIRMVDEAGYDLFRYYLLKSLIDSYSFKLTYLYSENKGKKFSGPVAKTNPIIIDRNKLEKINKAFFDINDLIGFKELHTHDSKRNSELEKKIGKLKKYISEISQEIKFSIQIEMDLLKGLSFESEPSTDRGNYNHGFDHEEIPTTSAGVEPISTAAESNVEVKTDKKSSTRKRNILKCCFFCISCCRKKEQIEETQVIEQPQVVGSRIEMTIPAIPTTSQLESVDPIYEAVDDPIYEAVDDPIYDAVDDPIYDAVDDLTYDAINDHLYSDLDEPKGPVPVVVKDERLPRGVPFEEFYRYKMTFINDIINKIDDIIKSVSGYLKTDKMLFELSQAKRYKRFLEGMYKENRGSMIKNGFIRNQNIKTYSYKILVCISRYKDASNCVNEYKRRTGEIHLNYYSAAERYFKQVKYYFKQACLNIRDIIAIESELLLDLEFETKGRKKKSASGVSETEV